jgi:hypothetical protein
MITNPAYDLRKCGDELLVVSDFGTIRFDAKLRSGFGSINNANVGRHVCS